MTLDDILLVGRAYYRSGLLTKREARRHILLAAKRAGYVMHWREVVDLFLLIR